MPPGFRFAVKASRFITHIKRLKGCEEPLKTFLEGATLLGDKLGPILYQLPPSFHYDDTNMQTLSEFLALLPREREHPFEFRHKSWFREELYELLRQYGVAFCAQDMVRMECPLLATAPYAYVRFHGSEGRYSGNYTEEILQGWAQRLSALAQDRTNVYVYFNNDQNAYAVYNARLLLELLHQKGVRSLERP